MLIASKIGRCYIWIDIDDKTVSQPSHPVGPIKDIDGMRKLEKKSQKASIQKATVTKLIGTVTLQREEWRFTYIMHIHITIS